jgi:hypothetical protein
MQYEDIGEYAKRIAEHLGDGWKIAHTDYDGEAATAHYTYLRGPGREQIMVSMADLPHAGRLRWRGLFGDGLRNHRTRGKTAHHGTVSLVRNDRKDPAVVAARAIERMLPEYREELAEAQAAKGIAENDAAQRRAAMDAFLEFVPLRGARDHGINTALIGRTYSNSGEVEITNTGMYIVLRLPHDAALVVARALAGIWSTRD